MALTLLVDENVPQSVAEYLRSRGHQIYLVSDFFLPGTPDPIIAAKAQEIGAVIVTWNHRDFTVAAVGRKVGQYERFPRLSILSFKCKEADGKRLLEASIEMFEGTVELTHKLGKRVLIEVRQLGPLKIIFDPGSGDT